MKVQENKNGALYVYLSKADMVELGWKKGDSLRSCIANGSLRLQKRGGPE